MKKILVIISTLIANVVSHQSNAQVIIDSALANNSEKWKVSELKKVADLKLTSFGWFSTVDAMKLDSPVYKKKTKEGESYYGEISSGGVTMDGDKVVMIEKKKHYRLAIVREGDSTSTLFSVFTASHERKQTVLGFFTSGSSRSSEVLDLKREVSGLIDVDSTIWAFNFSDFGQSPGAAGYIWHEGDTLHITSFAKAILIEDGKGNDLAALQLYDRKQLNVWIRKDLSNQSQHLIASAFAVMLAIRRLS